jgi:hypothetical protein
VRLAARRRRRRRVGRAVTHFLRRYLPLGPWPRRIQRASAPPTDDLIVRRFPLYEALGVVAGIHQTRAGPRTGNSPRRARIRRQRPFPQKFRPRRSRHALSDFADSMFNRPTLFSDHSDFFVVSIAQYLKSTKTITLGKVVVESTRRSLALNRMGREID